MPNPTGKTGPRYTTDVYGIRLKKPVFVYSGKTLMHILFCQPSLRNGRHTYNDCKININTP
jgi:hypothetical protein